MPWITDRGKANIALVIDGIICNNIGVVDIVIAGDERGVEVFVI